MASALARLSPDELDRLTAATGDLQRAIAEELAASPALRGARPVRPRRATPRAPPCATPAASPPAGPARRLRKDPPWKPRPPSGTTTDRPTVSVPSTSPTARRWRSSSRSCSACSSARSTRRSSPSALPTIVTDLGGQELLTWTITIYLLDSTITVPFYGKLSDLYGRKPLLMIGIVAVPHRLRAVRPQPEHDPADPVPRHPGPRRRRAVPDLARGHRRPVHARPSAASTRACSARCSASARSSARCSAAS